MSSAKHKLTARPMTGPMPGVSMPREFEPRRLLRRALQVGAVIAVILVIVALAPGLGEVRSQLEGARPGWIALAVALEALSCASYVVMFKPMFCPRMPWRTSWEIGLSELAMGSIVPASGAGGLALGAWILREGGMPGDQIARRSVAFFLLKSSVNFAAVAIVGTLMAVGLLGPHRSLLLTALPAAAATIVIGLVLLIPRVAPGGDPGADAGRARRAFVTLRRWVIDGTTEAVAILKTGRGNWQVLVGAFGYWFWDNAVIWATFHAFGYSPAVAVVLMGYLIGQLGGALPLPGGLGGIDGGLFGTFLVYGTPAAVTAAAVLAYRVILFWLPLLVGTVAFFSLRRGLNDPDRPELCVVPAAT
jgi:uncharacterized membrane protein YbhN (UPF0104 family)